MKKIFYSILFCCVFMPGYSQLVCVTEKYQQTQTPLYLVSSPQTSPGSIRDTLPDEVIIVPVVIHVLYNENVQNITDAQVLSQLEVLNNDFRKLNNVENIPSAFVSFSADARIVFCLAKADPIGKLTNGIIHKYTTKQSWLANDDMKFTASDGNDAWDSKRYLNIWVCDLSGKSPGYATIPGSSVDKDGIVIDYDAFGTTGTVRSPFNKGRTATHEVGHWLGLKHLWGDALCGDDEVGDTPPQRSYNNGCPSFPQTSTCSVNANGDMFMNFMDFTDDVCMSMFTTGQKNKMRSLFALGKPRNSFLYSKGCESPEPEERTLPVNTVVLSEPEGIISFYPNPAKNFIIIEVKNGIQLIDKTIKIYNFLGREMKTQLLRYQKNTISINELPAGIYILKIGEGRSAKIIKFVTN